MINPFKDFSALHWLLFGVVIVTICDMRYRSRTPVFNYYKENIASLRNDVEQFKGLVIGELIPHFERIELMTNMNDVVSASSANNITNSVKGLVSNYDILGGAVVEVADFRPCLARVGDYSINGVYLDGWFYREGDTFLGRPIISISPECVLCHGFSIVPRSSNVVRSSSVSKKSDFEWR